MGQTFGNIRLAAKSCDARKHGVLCGSKWLVDSGKGKHKMRVCYMCGSDRADAKLYRARKGKPSLPARQGSQSSRIRAIYPKIGRKQSRRKVA